MKKFALAALAAGLLISNAAADRITCPTAMENFRGELGNGSGVTTAGHVLNAASMEAAAAFPYLKSLWTYRETTLGRLSSMPINMGSTTGVANITVALDWQTFMTQIAIKLSHSENPAADVHFLLTPFGEKEKIVFPYVTDCSTQGTYFARDGLENVNSMIEAAVSIGKLPQFLGQGMKYIQFGNPNVRKKEVVDFENMPFSKIQKLAPI